MNMEKELSGGVLTVRMEGKLDQNTAPQAEKELKAEVKSAKKLVLDLKRLEYLSSAGLRLILKLDKAMKKKDGLTVRNVNSGVMEVFAFTGFTDILQIE
jgi:anti-sigma B factor antagonist